MWCSIINYTQFVVFYLNLIFTLDEYIYFSNLSNYCFMLIFTMFTTKTKKIIINEYTLVTITNVTKKEHSIYENYYGKVLII